MKHLVFSFFLLGVISATVSSCKKGCTNESAINYNSSAKADDASCLSCDSVLIDSFDRSGIWTETNTGPHYQEPKFYVTSMVKLYSYRGNYCSALGKKTTCATQTDVQTFAYCTFKIKNVRTDTISINGSIGFWLNNQNSRTFYFDHHILPPNEEINLGSPFYFGCANTVSAVQNYSPNFTVTYY